MSWSARLTCISLSHDPAAHIQHWRSTGLTHQMMAGFHLAAPVSRSFHCTVWLTLAVIGTFECCFFFCATSATRHDMSKRPITHLKLQRAWRHSSKQVFVGQMLKPLTHSEHFWEAYSSLSISVFACRGGGSENISLVRD